jgi:hypothetical protein
MGAASAARIVIASMVTMQMAWCRRVLAFPRTSHGNDATTIDNHVAFT